MTRALESTRREDPLRVVAWGSGILRDLVRLHDRGLFHGAVWPGAVRVDRDRARLASPEETPAPPEYRDPDRMRRAHRDPDSIGRGDPGADLFGAGATLYALLEGGPPPCGTASPFTRAVPRAVAYVVYRALADGAGRYPSARAMLADLERIGELARSRPLEGIDPSALPSFAGGKAPAPESLRPFRPRERSRRREILARTVVFALLLAGGVATAIRGTGERPVPSAPAAAPAPAPEEGLAGLLRGWQARIDDRLRALGERFDPLAVPLVLVSEVPVPAALPWPVHPSRALAARVRPVLREGVGADEVRRALQAAAPGDTLPALVWLTPAAGGGIRARLYYSGLALEGVTRTPGAR